MSDWNLEIGDMAIHFGAALGSTLLLGWAGSLVNPFLPTLVALLCLSVFYIRERYQQSKKNNPPTKPWLFWTWGPRGIAEFSISIPGVVLAMVILYVWII